MCAAVAAIVFTPEPGLTSAAGFAGWPRLELYALGGLALGLTAAHPCTAGRLRPLRIVNTTWRRGYLLVGLGTAASVVVTAVNVQRLRANIADPLGPALWVAAMAMPLVYTLLPQARRLGWPALWPEPQKVYPWRWLPLLTLTLIVLAAAAIRLPDLADIPQGINPDEGDRAATAFDVLSGQAPLSWFDSGWFFINMVYFRVLAASLTVFGPDVAGGRMLTALVGVAFVAAVGWIGVRNFGWRLGLFATAFAAGMQMTIQHSRLITEAGVTGLLWAISLGGFLEGARSGRVWAWAVAGLSGGLSLYFYPSARLWAVGAVLTVVVILVFLRDRRPFPGIAVAVLASIAASAPFLVHLSQHPDEAAGRYAQTAVADPRNQERLAYLKPPEPISDLVALQVERTVGMFDRYPDGGGFLPVGRPIFGPPLAQVALVGAVYLLVRALRDVRVAMLSIWFWLGLSGVALTVETPDYLRSVGMLPSLCFVLALPLVDVIDRLLGAERFRRPVLAGAAPAVIALLLLVPEVVSYFVTFRTLPSSWGPETREGRLIAELGSAGPVYSVEMNEHTVNSGWVKLLAPHAERGRVPNPGRELPVLAPTGAPVAPGEVRPEFAPSSGQALTVVLSADPNQRPYVPLLQQLYPQAVVGDGGDGRTLIRVSADALASTFGATLVGATAQARAVGRLGEIPADVSLPATLTWRTAVRLPKGATYTFSVTAPQRAQLRIDDTPVADGVGSLSAQVQAAPGLHFLEMQSDVSTPGDHVTLTVGGSQLQPEQTYRLMDAPWGLLARLGRTPSSSGNAVTDAHLDSTVSMAFEDPELGFVAIPNSLVWTGSLLVPRSGAYRMAFAAEDAMHLSLDGVPVEVVTVKPDDWGAVGSGSIVQLSEGAHRVEVRLDITHGGRELARWNWVPPQPNGVPDLSAAWSVVPPAVLRPDLPIALAPPAG